MKKRGFSLITFVIIVAIISVSAYIIVELLYKQSEASLETKVSVEINELLKASIGDMNVKFGFLGDMGRLPQTISELIYQGNLPSPSENPSGSGIYSGWRGPYIEVKVKNAQGIVDPYGNNYSIILLEDDGSGNFRSCTTSCSYWIIFSPGKDHRFNSQYPIDKSYQENKDNIWAPSTPLKVNPIGNSGYYTIYTQKTVRVNSLRSEFLPTNLRITVYYPDNGNPSYSYEEFGNPYEFSNIPVGKRIIKIEILNDRKEAVKTFFYPETFNHSKKSVHFSINEVVETLSTLRIEYSGANKCSSNYNCNSIIVLCSSTFCIMRYMLLPCRNICCEQNKCSLDPFKSYCCKTCFGIYGWFITNCNSSCCSGPGGSRCNLKIEVDSSLNSSGATPHFNLHLKGFNEDGEKVYENSNFTKNTSSPFFVLEDPNAPCTIRSIRIESSGAGGNITKTVSPN